MEEAIKGNRAPVKVGELAQPNESSRAVKDIGRMLEMDHKAGSDKAMPIAKSVAATIPTAPDKNAKSDYDKLAKLNGHHFDAKFIDAIINEQKKDIDKSKTRPRTITQRLLNSRRPPCQPFRSI